MFVYWCHVYESVSTRINESMEEINQIPNQYFISNSQQQWNNVQISSSIICSLETQFIQFLCNKKRTQLCNIIKFLKNKENCQVKIQQIIINCTVVVSSTIYSCIHVVDYCRHNRQCAQQQREILFIAHWNILRIEEIDLSFRFWINLNFKTI